MDATQEQTDVAAFAPLEPIADGFRNYQRTGDSVPAEERLLDRAHLLTLSAPEMTVLVGGLRVLGVNAGQGSHGLLTKQPGKLTNDFFVNLLDMKTAWKSSASQPGVFEGRDRASNEPRWTGTRADLLFGSNSQVRAIAEVYGSQDAKQTFARDFATAWSKVMDLDRYDLG
jgi:catalase-peroxidase